MHRLFGVAHLLGVVHQLGIVHNPAPCRGESALNMGVAGQLGWAPDSRADNAPPTPLHPVCPVLPSQREISQKLLVLHSRHSVL